MRRTSNVRDLADVVRDGVQERLGDVLGAERALLPAALLLEHLPERARDHRRLEPELAVAGPVDVAHEHVHRLVVALLRQREHLCTAVVIAPWSKDTIKMLSEEALARRER